MEKNEKIQIDVSPEFQDFLRVIFWQTFRKVWFIFLIALILIPIFLAGIYSAVNRGEFSPLIFMPLIPPLIALVILYNIYSSAKKISNSVKGKVQWIFSEKGFQTFSPIGTSESAWSGLEEILETDNEFLLFPQKPIFIIVPKRSFPNDLEINKFKELINNQLGNKAKLRK